MSPPRISFNTASVDITPASPVPLFGYQHIRGPFQSISSKLECNAVLFRQGEQRIFLLQFDTLFPSRELNAALQARLTQSCEILSVSSHTHFAPALDHHKPLLGPISEEYFNDVVQAVAEALNRMLSETQAEGTLSSTEISCPANIFRRKRTISFQKRWPFFGIETAQLPNPVVQVDDRLTTYALRNTSGDIQAILWNWACHPVACPKDHSVSADYVGFVREEIRKKYGKDIPVVFLPGFMGDLRPRIVTRHPSIAQRIRYPINNLFFSRPISEPEFLNFCEQVSQAVVQSLSNEGTPTEFRGNLKLDRGGVPLKEVLTSESATVIPLACLQLSSTVRMVFIGAEVASGYAPLVRQQFGTGTIPVGYFEEIYGYLPLESQIPEGGYEVTVFLYWFSLSGKFRPGFQKLVMNTLQKLCAPSHN